MSYKLKESKLEHEVTYQELSALLVKHAGSLTSLEVLAVAANMLGKIIALQDQTKVTRELALEIVSKNIEIGNKQVLDTLGQSIGRV